MSRKIEEMLAKQFEDHNDLPAAIQAREGYYGDFTSPLAAPQTALYTYAHKNGYHDIMQGVLDGKYDG